MPRYWVTWDHDPNLGLQASFPFWPVETADGLKGFAAVIADDDLSATEAVHDSFRWLKEGSRRPVSIRVERRPDAWSPFSDRFVRQAWHEWPDGEVTREEWADEPWAPMLDRALAMWEARERELMEALQAAIAPCNCGAPPGTTKHPPECLAGATAKELAGRLERVMKWASGGLADGACELDMEQLRSLATGETRHARWLEA